MTFFPTTLAQRTVFFFFSLTAVKNQVTGNFILNAKSEDAESRTFIENGLQWEYTIDAAKETLKTSGPLHEGIVVLVSGTASLIFLHFPEFHCLISFSSPRHRSFPWKKMQRSAWRTSISYTRTCYRWSPTTMSFWLSLTRTSGRWRAGLSAPNLVGEVSEFSFQIGKQFKLQVRASVNPRRKWQFGYYLPTLTERWMESVPVL